MGENDDKAMDACEAIENEVNNVLEKFTTLKGNCSTVLVDLITGVTNLKNDLQNAASEEQSHLTDNQVANVQEAMANIKRTVGRLATDHRDLHSTVSKVGKAIDRNFDGDYAVIVRDDTLASAETVDCLNRLICEHYNRQQEYGVAEALAKEANVSIGRTYDHEVYGQIHRLLVSLMQRDLQPAQDWVQEHLVELEAVGSTLEFKLHRLRFIEIVRQGIDHQTVAIQYARSYFEKFIERHEKDIKALMGMLLYVPHGLDSSPYSDFLNIELWLDVYDNLLRDGCTLLNINMYSPLQICLNAGCKANLALLNIKQVMFQRNVDGYWQGKDELPIEIDVGADGKYHSMFSCPILRQQSSLQNPPMRLTCRHVISKDAMHKLSNSSAKVKCPYCPMEQNTCEAKQVFF